MNTSAALLLATLFATTASILTGCTEMPAFDSGDRPPGPVESIRRLTYNPGRDRAPTWSADGDSIYYAAEGFISLPSAPGVPVAMAREGGAVRPLLQNVQVGPRRHIWLTAPTVSPDGGRIAYVEPLLYNTPMCIGTRVCDLNGMVGPPPMLERMVLRVRPGNATGTVSDDPALRITFRGRSFDGTRHPEGLPGVYVTHAYPFQIAYQTRSMLVFRPSWAPDGERLVYSDGLHLWIWEPGTGTPPQMLSGTLDAVTPAWGPNGEWIAYTLFARVDSVTANCDYIQAGGGGVLTTCVEERVIYDLAPPAIMVIRPDGTGRRQIARGVEPAWGPRGQFVYYSNDSGIHRIAPSGGEPPTTIAHTENGREPAVSPDGEFLAFSRRSSSGFDIWITPLQAGAGSTDP